MASSTVIITAPDKTKFTYVLSEKDEWKEYKEKEYPVENYNLSARMFTEYGILINLKDYMEATKGEFSYDGFVKYLKGSMIPTKRNSGYYTTDYHEFEPEYCDYTFGKLKEDYESQRYQKLDLDMSKKYLVELRPRFIENFTGDYTVRNDIFYTWVCKAVNAPGDPAYFLVNEDCELTGEELLNLRPDISEKSLAEDPKNPDIYIWLVQMPEEMGASGAICFF